VISIPGIDSSPGRNLLGWFIAKHEMGFGHFRSFLFQRPEIRKNMPIALGVWHYQGIIFPAKQFSLPGKL
jgi:hypothetical protein